jgi:hypothetical protein
MQRHAAIVLGIKEREGEIDILHLDHGKIDESKNVAIQIV